jgi:hypothetical protein
MRREDLGLTEKRGVDSMQEVKANSQVPYESELDVVLARIPVRQRAQMETAIHAWADATTDNPDDFFASNWKTGPNWQPTPFQPLYETIGDAEQAGKTLGSLVRRVIIQRVSQRGERWYMYRNPEAGTDSCPRQFWGTFYWRHR